MKNFIKSVVVVSGLFLCFAVNAQDNSAKEEEDLSALIAPYPSDVRDAILDVSQYSQKLVKVDRMQAGTSQSFKDLVAKYPRAIQEKFYDLSRYPDLIHQMTESDNEKSRSEINTILAAYPREVAAGVKDLYPAYYPELKSMDKIFQESEASLRENIGSLPTESQNNFIKVIGMPDVMKILTENIDQTVILGEAYRNNPEEIKQNLEELNAQVTAQNAKDLEDYKKQVASDPKLQSEMKQSSDEFSANYGRDDYPTNGNNNQPVVNNYYNTNPYPYWFGYPYWYPTAVWYPQPLYYQTGFYVAGGNVVVVGLPSYAYSHWFFGFGYHRYPMMYNRYHSYYSYYYRPAYYRSNYARREHYNGGNYSNSNSGYYQNHNNGNQQSRGRTGGESRYSPQNNGSINGRSGGNTRPSNPVTVDRSQSRGSFNGGSSFNAQRSGVSRSQFNQQRPVNNGGAGISSGRPSSGMRSGGFSGVRSGSMGGGSRSSGTIGGGSRGSSGGGRRGR